MAVTGAILRKQNGYDIIQCEQNILPHATYVGNKRKQTEYSNVFVIFNIVSIVSSPKKKEDQNEVHHIRDLLQCTMSSAYRRTKRLLQKMDI